MSIPNLRAIRDWCKEKINGIEESLIVNGTRLYLDFQNGKYGVNTDPKRGADTFTPFRASAAPEQSEEKQIIKASYSGALAQQYANRFEFLFDDFDMEKLTKLSLNSFVVKGSKTSGAGNPFIRAGIIVADSSGNAKDIQLQAMSSWNTATITMINMLGREYDLTGLRDVVGDDAVQIIGVYCSIDSYGSSASNLMRIKSMDVDVVVQYTS